VTKIFIKSRNPFIQKCWNGLQEFCKDGVDAGHLILGAQP
jgi:hypothetical protein